MPEQGDDSNISYVKEAFLWQYNLIALAGAAAFALISGSAFPLLLAAGLELIYLSTVPHSRRFRRAALAWRFEARRRREQKRLWQLYRELPREMQSRYVELDKTCREIFSNYGRLSTASRLFSRQLGDRLSSLLEAYLRLLHSAFLHRQHLRLTDPGAIRREIAGLARDLEAEPPKVQEINRKRIEILSKRLEKYDKVKENQAVIDAQCAAIEDVLRLIRDQSLTIRDPQELTDQLDHVLHEVEHTEETIREMEAIFELAAPELGPGLPADTVPGPARRARRRLRS